MISIAANDTADKIARSKTGGSISSPSLVAKINDVPIVAANKPTIWTSHLSTFVPVTRSNNLIDESGHNPVAM
jgi:hypothetical protein